MPLVGWLKAGSTCRGRGGTRGCLGQRVVRLSLSGGGRLPSCSRCAVSACPRPRRTADGDHVRRGGVEVVGRVRASGIVSETDCGFGSGCENHPGLSDLLSV